MMNGDELNDDHTKDSMAIVLLNTSNIFPQYNDGLQWEHRNGILSMLKDSVLDNKQPVLSQFTQQQQNTTLGKINALMRNLGNYADVQQNKNIYLQQIGSIGSGTNTVEQNYVWFMREYLNNILDAKEISQSAYSGMQSLAKQCPYSDGAVVYNARALMKIWGDETAYVNVCELSQSTEAGEQGKKQQMPTKNKMEEVLIYPNPNNGTFTLNYTFSEMVQPFELYDLMGREIVMQKLDGDKGEITIHTEGLTSGVYFYKIVNNKAELMHTGKLIISK